MDEIRWNAVRNNDKTADGKFYYGVKTTKIFCLPSCKSKLPKEKNVVFFDSYKQAIDMGFRPCKRCRPDLNSTYSPNEDLINDIKTYLDNNFDSSQCLYKLNERFCVSSFHFVRIFKNKFQVTPREYVLNCRIEESKKLLVLSEVRIIDIAFKSGFSSYTSFFTNFKKRTGISPVEYRKNHVTY